MNPLQDLISTFSKKPNTSGTVINQVSQSSYLVAVRSGTLSCTSAINSALRVGDKVALSGSTIVSKLANDTDIPNFIV